MKKKIVSLIIFIIILIVLIWLCVEAYTDNKIKNRQTGELEYSLQNVNAQSYIEKEVKQYPKEEIINDYKGYKVIAKLEIPIINLETYILEKYSEETLNVSVTKFWGANPNIEGNFCIAGHNFKNENMFRNLKKLEIGNKLFISDNTVGKVEYEIYDLYKVLPEDVSCLSQETNGKREVTLITCTTDSKERIIVKASETEE